MSCLVCQEVLNLKHTACTEGFWHICFASRHSANKFSSQLEYITCMLEVTVEQLWCLDACGQFRDSLALAALM